MLNMISSNSILERIEEFPYTIHADVHAVHVVRVVHSVLTDTTFFFLLSFQFQSCVRGFFYSTHIFLSSIMLSLR